MLFTYEVCRACAPRFQLVRSAPCAGSSAVRFPAGVWRFQLPLRVRLIVVPELEPGGVKSKLPNSEPWSLRRLDARPLPTAVGIRCAAAMASRRWTESADTPAAWRPPASVLSSVRRSFARRPSWYDKL